MSTAPDTDRKGHVCPPSNAKHPSDRWEAMFIYSFICKFTNLRGKVEGLETPMDFENALLSREPNPIVTQILSHFVRNLRPQTRNLSTDQISTTVSNLLLEYINTPERTVFWNDERKRNVDPFEGLEGGFFASDWDFKLKVLRQLVELQLTHNPDIKTTIDRAWGVVHNKHKKKEPAMAPPDPTDPKSQEKLQLLPLGQDNKRKRYWIVDDSPRIYVSTNPWKVTATFQTISSTREEYMANIESLKASSSPSKEGGKRPKTETNHLELIKLLEDRLEGIDAELVRVQKVRRKIEQRAAFFAQAEVRETRTRRQAQRPDYVYQDVVESDDDGDEYTFQEDEEDYDDQFEEDDFLHFRTNGSSSRRASASTGRRRSTRTSTINANGKREAPDAWSQWRGERRSTRLGAPPDTQLDAVPGKRARTEESTVSANSAEAPSVGTSHAGTNDVNRTKVTGAAAVKPTETAVEQIAGKKKSKFWFYAVEPIHGSAPVAGSSSSFLSNSSVNGYKSNEDRANGQHVGHDNGMDYDQSLDSDGSLSPVPSVDS